MYTYRESIQSVEYGGKKREWGKVISLYIIILGKYYIDSEFFFLPCERDFGGRGAANFPFVLT